jgi:hypothetical protein
MSLFTPPYARPKTDDEDEIERVEVFTDWVKNGQDISPDRYWASS